MSPPFPPTPAPERRDTKQVDDDVGDTLGDDAAKPELSRRRVLLPWLLPPLLVFVVLAGHFLFEVPRSEMLPRPTPEQRREEKARQREREREARREEKARREHKDPSRRQDEQPVK